MYGDEVLHKHTCGMRPLEGSKVAYKWMFPLPGFAVQIAFAHGN